MVRERELRVSDVERFNAAFARFVPREFLRQLERRDVRDVELGDHVEREMGVMFCNIRGFTALCDTLSPAQTFEFLNAYLARIGPIVREYRGFVDKYLGDGVMALFPGSVEDVLDAAIALQREVRSLNTIRAGTGLTTIRVGVGLHRGDLMLGTIGETERYDTTVIAGVVNVAARLESLTKVYDVEILASDAIVSTIKNVRRESDDGIRDPR